MMFFRSICSKVAKDPHNLRVKGGVCVFLSGLSILAFKGMQSDVSDVAQADEFEYKDPVDGFIPKHQGIRYLIKDSSRMVDISSILALKGMQLDVSDFVQADEFEYKDPVDGFIPKRQRIQYLIKDSSRMVDISSIGLSSFGGPEGQFDLMCSCRDEEIFGTGPNHIVLANKRAKKVLDLQKLKEFVKEQVTKKDKDGGYDCYVLTDATHSSAIIGGTAACVYNNEFKLVALIVGSTAELNNNTAEMRGIKRIVDNADFLQECLNIKAHPSILILTDSSRCVEFINGKPKNREKEDHWQNMELKRLDIKAYDGEVDVMLVPGSMVWPCDFLCRKYAKFLVELKCIKREDFKSLPQSVRDGLGWTEGEDY